MKHLDLTIDFETCSLSANAAPMQVAIVPWNRDSKEDPFSFQPAIEPFVDYVDLRTCVVDGFDFDPATIRWWSERNNAAKKAVTDGFAEPVADVLIGILDYIRNIIIEQKLTSICLWCQGTDIDVAILRNICYKYDVNLDEVIPHTQFRDCRTIISEAALVRSQHLYQETAGNIEDMSQDTFFNDVLTGSQKLYRMFNPLPERYANGRESHDALYDALRSSWNTWQALCWLRGTCTKPD